MKISYDKQKFFSDAISRLGVAVLAGTMLAAVVQPNASLGPVFFVMGVGATVFVVALWIFPGKKGR